MVDPFDPEELMVCPYDPVHKVARKRFTYHLIKCRKNYNTRDYATCPFNARHVFPKPEMDYHIQTCEDRGRLEIEMLHDNTVYHSKGNTELPIVDWNPPDGEESWEDDDVSVRTKLVGDRIYSSTDQQPSFYKKPAHPKPPPVRPPVVPDPPVTVRMFRAPAASGQDVFQYSLNRVSGSDHTVQHQQLAPLGRGRGRGSVSGRGSVLVGAAGPSGSPPGSGVGPGNRVGVAKPIHCSPLKHSPQKMELGAREPATAVASLGAGRGRGRGAPQDIAYAANPPGIGRGHVTVDPAPPSQPPAVTEQEISKEIISDTQKKVRKLKKMLRQIEDIEQRKQAGQELNNEQLAKLSRRDDVEVMLAKTENELSVLLRGSS